MYSMGMYIDMEEHTSLVLEHIHQCSVCYLLALELRCEKYFCRVTYILSTGPIPVL